MLRTRPEGRLDLAELAVITGSEITESFISQLCGRGQDLIGPGQKFLSAQLEGVHVLSPGLVDRKPDAPDVVQISESIQGTERIALELAVIGRFDQDADTVYRQAVEYMEWFKPASESII